MIGETFDSVCQIAHTLFGILCVVLAAYLFGSPLGGWSALFIWSVVKEFWYDINYESPSDSGGWLGSLKDFGFYNLGAAIGYVTTLMHA